MEHCQQNQYARDISIIPWSKLPIDSRIASVGVPWLDDKENGTLGFGANNAT